MTRRGLLERLYQLFNGMRADNLRALGLILDKVVYFGDGSIENGDLVAVVVHIQNQILTHHREANQSDVAICVWHSRSGRDSPEN